MPVKGWKTVTITCEVYDKLAQLAEKKNRSPAKQIEYFLKTCKET
jgi:hypothetical protein